MAFVFYNVFVKCKIVFLKNKSHETKITAVLCIYRGFSQQKLFRQGHRWIMNGTESCPPLVKWQTDMKVQCFRQVCSFALPVRLS